MYSAFSTVVVRGTLGLSYMDKHYYYDDDYWFCCLEIWKHCYVFLCIKHIVMLFFTC